MPTSQSVAAVLDGLSLGSQHKRLLRLQFPRGGAPSATMLVNQLEASEGLSRDFHYRVEVLSSDPDIPLKDMLGKLVTVELVREDGSLRYFNGHVFEFRFVRTDGGYCHYDMVLLPWLAYLRLRRDNYIFHYKTVLAQTGDIFGDYPDAAWETRSLGSDAEMTDASQFDESDYNYLHRRWEERGWHYWYEHTASGHTLVLSGDSTLSAPIDGPHPDIPWQAEAGTSEDDAIAQFTPVRVIASGASSTTGFDFKSPRVKKASVPSINQQGAVPQLEVYDFAGGYGFANQSEADALVRRRVESIEAGGKHFEAQGNDRYVQPGRWFKLTGHYQSSGEGNNQFLIIEARHSASNNYETNGKVPPVYSNSLSCLRKKIPWRPAQGQNSSSPRIYGLQTAIVVGPPGEEIHTDEYARVRVQFHWDREGSYDHRSSAWVRVASPWAGSNFGMVAIPRIGQEVVVQFLDGNPDRPLITGRVYNQDNMPPWELPANKTQTGILTRSSTGGAPGAGLKDGPGDANALRFEDKKGQEQLWLHAQKDQLTEVENDEDKWVGQDRRKTIDRDETNTIHRDRTETVDRNEKITVHGWRTEEVDGDETITIHSNRTERVDHNESISIGDNRTEVVGLNESIGIGVNRTETVGSNESINIGANRSKTVGGNEKDKISKNWSIKVDKTKTETIGMAYMQNVGLGRMENVGLGYNLNVGMVMASVVGMSYSLNVGIGGGGGGGGGGAEGSGQMNIVDSSGGQGGGDSAGGGGSSIKMDADSITLKVGKSILVMTAEGQVTINGQEIDLVADKHMGLESERIDIN